MPSARFLPFCIVAALYVYGQPAGKPKQPEVVPQPGAIGSRMPEFAVKDFNGRQISSSALRGKVVLIDFWATWCAPCKKEMPGYQQLLDRYGSRGLAVVGLKSNMMADTEDPARFARSIRVTYPLVVATDDLVRKFGGIEGLPTTLIYDRQGILRAKIIGFEYMQTIEAALKALL
jgi:thiol-disulfide isomerase/thioredoxin